jgi:glutaredoxin-related protein
MCCSTGVCGPEPDKALIEFNETLKRLQSEYKDLKITRASLSFNIAAFLDNKDIFQTVKENGPGILPITTMDGKIVFKQSYPSYVDLRKEIESP